MEQAKCYLALRNALLNSIDVMGVDVTLAYLELLLQLEIQLATSNQQHNDKS